MNPSRLPLNNNLNLYGKYNPFMDLFLSALSSSSILSIHLETIEAIFKLTISVSINPSIFSSIFLIIVYFSEIIFENFGNLHDPKVYSFSLRITFFGLKIVAGVLDNTMVVLQEN